MLGHLPGHGLALPMAGLFRRPTPQADVDTAWASLCAKLAPPYEIDTSLLAVLNALVALLPGDGYYAYTAPRPGEPLRLRVTRTATGTPTIGPNYAGLVTGSTPRPAPLEVPPPANPEALELGGTASDPYLSLTCGLLVVLRVALRARQGPTQAQRQALLAFARRLRPVADMLVHTDTVKEQIDATALDASVSRRALEMALQVNTVLDLLCQLGAQSLAATSGYLATWPTAAGATELSLEWRYGDAAELQGALDPRQVRARLQPRQVATWLQPNLPAPLQRLGLDAYVFIPLDAGSARAAALVYGSTATQGGRVDYRQVPAILAQAASDALRDRLLTAHLSRTYLDTLIHVCDLLDAADRYNGAHSQQVSALAERLCQALGLPADRVAAIKLAGRLHDLGMVAVNLELPLKPGTLSDAERELVRRHPAVGADLVAGLPDTVVPGAVGKAIRHHHERWDGWGYPGGLAGEDIPLEARIIACAETLVARLSARSYRQGLHISRALYEVKQAAGTQLDPAIVAALIELYARQGIEPKAPDA